MSDVGFDPIDKTSNKETIENYLKALAKELGYTPTMPMTMGCKQIIKKYGSWFAALDDAGLERSNTEHQEILRAQMNSRHFEELILKVIKKRSTYENKSKVFNAGDDRIDRIDHGIGGDDRR